MIAEGSGFDSEDFEVSLQPLFSINIQMHNSRTVILFGAIKN
jgi:hypothetical protein